MEEAVIRVETQSNKRAGSLMPNLEVRLMQSCTLKAGIGSRGLSQGADCVGEDEYFPQSGEAE